ALVPDDVPTIAGSIRAAFARGRPSPGQHRSEKVDEFRDRLAQAHREVAVPGSRGAEASHRGRGWFEALAGSSRGGACDPRSVLVADAALGEERVRFLAVVEDSAGRFTRARGGEVGLEEAWGLARGVREAVLADVDDDRRTLVAIVDVPSQAYGRVE